jgi:hypothetical protein
MNSKFSPLLTPFMHWSTSNYCSLNVAAGASPSPVCWVYVIISFLSRAMPALRLVDRWVVLNHCARSRQAQISFPHPEPMLKNIRQNVGGSAVVREGRFEPSRVYALGSRPYMAPVFPRPTLRKRACQLGPSTNLIVRSPMLLLDLT